MKKIINLFEAFSGIGSQHQALKNLGYDVNVIGISDWYIDAIVAYGVTHLGLKPKKIDRKKVIKELSLYSLSRDSKQQLKSFGGVKDEWLSIVQQVIRKFGTLDINFLSGELLSKKDRIDLFTYSFPCQDISQQGKKCGFSKGCKTRSGLLWEVERILKEIKDNNKNKLPRVLMMENVKALLNKDFEDDLNEWINTLSELGYKSTNPFILNAADLGEPQRRERVFMISYLEGEPKEFKLEGIYKKRTLGDIVDFNVDREKVKLNDNIKIIKNFGNGTVKKGFLEGYTSFNAENYVYYLDSIAPTITASGAQSRIKFFGKDGNIYFLNGLEHLLLQGFTKDFYNKLIDIGLTENKIKFLAGNSINVRMLEAIFNFYL